MVKKKEEIIEPIVKPSFNRDWLMGNRSEGVLKKYHNKFKGKTIGGHYRGEILNNKYGECYKISNKVIFESFEPNYDSIKQKLLLNLTVIPGISQMTETNLRKEGINSVSDLINHIRYGKDAQTYHNFVENKNALKIYEQLSSRFTSTNPLLLLNSALFNLSDIAFFDIETLGLSSCPLFLIGIATFKNNELIIDQIFARDTTEEKSALHFFSEYLQDKKAIVTFNGKSFDVPFVRKRMERFDMNHSITHPHFDLIYFSRTAFSDFTFSDFGFNCSLSNLETMLFQVQRVDDVPSYLIPKYYKTYLETRNIGSVVPIIDHNKQDLISTVKIFMKLHDLWS